MNCGKYGTCIPWKDQGSVFQEVEKPKSFVFGPKRAEGFPSKAEQSFRNESASPAWIIQYLNYISAQYFIVQTHE